MTLLTPSKTTVEPTVTDEGLTVAPLFAVAMIWSVQVLRSTSKIVKLTFETPPGCENPIVIVTISSPIVVCEEKFMSSSSDCCTGERPPVLVVLSSGLPLRKRLVSPEIEKLTVPPPTEKLWLSELLVQSTVSQSSTASKYCQSP